jgi:Protein of unknown function DUF2617
VLVSLDIPYADTTAADLSFALGLPAQDALHVLAIPDAGLQLRLLGASHQIVLAGRCVETVACLPGRTPHLPAAVADPVSGYRFTAQVRRLTPAGMAGEVAALKARLTDDPYALVGVFPSSPEAVTALLARVDTGAGTVGWHTWHAYPQTGELVVTGTEVTR